MKRARVLMAGIGSGLVFAFSAMAANSASAGVGTVEFTEGSPSGLNIERTQAARAGSFLRGPRTGLTPHRR